MRMIRTGPAIGLPPAPARGALLGEGAHALAQVLGREARAAQLDELALHVGVEAGPGPPELADDALVAAHAERRVAGELLGPLQRLLLDVGRQHDRVDEAPALGGARVDVAPEEEELAGAGRADRGDEPPQPRVRVHEPELR